MKQPTGETRLNETEQPEYTIKKNDWSKNLPKKKRRTIHRIILRIKHPTLCPVSLSHMNIYSTQAQMFVKYIYALCEFLSHRRARLPSQPIVTEAFPTAG
jgi:hypothetical protein